jgi:hypothetical protein
MNTYHQVHYGLFHKVLPGLMFAREDFRSEILGAVRGGAISRMLSTMWDKVAERTVEEHGPDDDLVGVGPRSFGAKVYEGTDGRIAIAITTPEVKGPVEAAVVVAVLDDESGNGSMRYFACEAPGAPGAPWMVGEWKSNGSRSNLGIVEDPSPDGFMRTVSTLTRFEAAEVRRPARARHNNTEVREIPDIDALLRERAGDVRAPRTRAEDEQRTGETRDVFGGGRARLGGVAEPKKPHDPHGSTIPAVAGPIEFVCTWEDDPHALASEALVNLYRLLNAGGSALVMKTKKTKGLGKKTSSYVQFMWGPDHDFVIEVQGDYSYWGLSVPSSAWPQLERCGLSIPTGGVGNFGRAVAGSATHEQRLQALTDVFGAFVAVLQPTGKIQPVVIGMPEDSPVSWTSPPEDGAERKSWW